MREELVNYIISCLAYSACSAKKYVTLDGKAPSQENQQNEIGNENKKQIYILKREKVALFPKRGFDIRCAVKADGGEFSRATVTFFSQTTHYVFYIQHNKKSKIIQGLFEKAEYPKYLIVNNSVGCLHNASLTVNYSSLYLKER